MKKKKYITLIAALTLSSAFVLNGCSLALPGEETKISTGAELSAEQEILTDGNVQLYTHWSMQTVPDLPALLLQFTKVMTSYFRELPMETEIWKPAHFRATRNCVV